MGQENLRYSIKVGKKEYSDVKSKRLRRRLNRRKKLYNAVSKVSFVGAGFLAAAGLGEIAAGIGYGKPILGAIAGVVSEAGAIGLFQLSKSAEAKADQFGAAAEKVIFSSSFSKRRIRELRDRH